MAYSKQTWVNGSGGPLNATRLNYIETGIEAAAAVADARPARSILTITTTTTLAAAAATDYVYFLNTGAVPTLPTAVSNTNKYTIKNITTGTINLAASSSQNIEGTAGPLAIGAGASFDLISDGAGWRII